jgi:hypothetical protein
MHIPEISADFFQRWRIGNKTVPSMKQESQDSDQNSEQYFGLRHIDLRMQGIILDHWRSYSWM